LSDFEKKRALIESLGAYVSAPIGKSMRPMLRGKRDTIRVEAPDGRLRRYDVALYARRDGKHVLHRVIRVRENDYVMRGDNCDDSECGITDEMIIGRLVGFWRGERYVSCDATFYRLYVRVHMALYPFRFLRIRTLRFLRKCLSRIPFLRALWRKLRRR
jgi:hypothetical protein